MLERRTAPLLVLLLIAVIGCSGEESAADGTKPGGGGKRAGNLNVAVGDFHWGPERVVYAADLEGYWESHKTKPGGEQWHDPPEGLEYFKFTFHGKKLARLETFGENGRPHQRLKAGVKVEWKYAAHGGLLEETGYNEEGGVDEHNTRRYDASNRLVEEMYGYGGGEVVAKVVYTYNGDSKHPAGSKTLDAGGTLLSASTYTYSAGGTERTDKYETYEATGNVRHTRTSKQRWNADEGEWEDVGE